MAIYDHVNTSQIIMIIYRQILKQIKGCFNARTPICNGAFMPSIDHHAIKKTVFASMEMANRLLPALLAKPSKTCLKGRFTPTYRPQASKLARSSKSAFEAQNYAEALYCLRTDTPNDQNPEVWHGLGDPYQYQEINNGLAGL